MTQAASAEDASPPAHHRVRGLLLFLFGLLLFASMDASTKFLAARYEVPFIVGVRYIVHCLLMVALLAPVHGGALVRADRTALVVLRGACIAAGSLFVGLALQRMPVAETTALNFIAPLAVILLARPILGERIGTPTLVGAVAGFAGMLLIARPGSGLDPIGVLFVLCGVAGAVAYQMLSRMLAHTEQTLTLLFYTALVGSLVFGPAVPFFRSETPPGLGDMALLLWMGISGGVGHFLFTAAYRHAPASLLAPMSYMQLVWAGMFGWMVFGHVPDGLSMAGMALIAGSGVLIALTSPDPRTRMSPAVSAEGAADPPDDEIRE